MNWSLILGEHYFRWGCLSAGCWREYFDPRGRKWHEVVPLQAWSGPEGSRNLRFPDFTTTAQDGGKVVSLTHWPPLSPENAAGTHIC